MEQFLIEIIVQSPNPCLWCRSAAPYPKPEDKKRRPSGSHCISELKERVESKALCQPGLATKPFTKSKAHGSHSVAG